MNKAIKSYIKNGTNAINNKNRYFISYFGTFSVEDYEINLRLFEKVGRVLKNYELVIFGGVVTEFGVHSGNSMILIRKSNFDNPFETISEFFSKYSDDSVEDRRLVLNMIAKQSCHYSNLKADVDYYRVQWSWESL